ncbi:E3 ubiquitin-protein ligase RNF186-like [Sebastes umbrosus]|uniref:E3 ubiquitin-protein ligase RNF186-like n=1 Tax=Sebastes umbrosus TaxID=72105 RepID=UPI00189D307B|nr:E3 ubiquitin-protein ligase RNF186-like [Sebastes umbrosus]
MAEEALSTAGGDCGSSAPPDDTDSFLSDEYECKICYNYFDLDLHLPKVLSCSHTFCQQCLEALHLREGRGWRVGCPVCRHRTPVPEYRVRNLPDNSELIESLPLKKKPLDSSINTDSGPAVSSSSAPSGESDDSSCQTCKQVAFMTGCVCAIFSFLSMVVLLFLGLIFVHNFNHTTWPVGPVCLFVASVLALLSLILTWLMCMLKYRPETEASHFSSLTSM